MKLKVVETISVFRRRNLFADLEQIDVHLRFRIVGLAQLGSRRDRQARCVHQAHQVLKVVHFGKLLSCRVRLNVHCQGFRLRANRRLFWLKRGELDVARVLILVELAPVCVISQLILFVV